MASKELMLRVARMSHVSKMKNQPIADQLFQEGLLSSADARKVQKIIEEAGAWLLQEQERLAELEGADTQERQLAERLCRKFDLIDARVVSGGEVRTPDDYADLIRQFGRAGAKYFDDLSSAAEILNRKLHVSVAGGQTVLDIVSSLHERKRPNVHYYACALIGRGRRRTTHVGPETTATIAWSRSGRFPGQLYYGTVPAYRIADSDFRDLNPRQRHKYARELITEQLEKIAADGNFRNIVEDMSDQINMALAAIGLVNPTGIDAELKGGFTERLTITQLLRLLGIEPQLLWEEGAVGELSYAFFNAMGQSNPRWRFFLTAGDGSEHSGVDFYRGLVERKCPVIVAAAARKEAALLPAVKAKLFNVLITDASTAKKLLGA